MRILKRIATVVAVAALTVAMGTTCFAASWGSYFGANEAWVEGAMGSLKSSSATGWTAKLDAIGWGGCWGAQVFQKKLKLKKGTEYQLKFSMKSDTIDKWVFIKVATDENIAYGDWIQLKAGKTTNYDVKFKAKCDANSIYFGIGGDFGDRAEGTDEAKGAIYNYSDKLPNDGDATYATTITTKDFYLGEPAAASDKKPSGGTSDTSGSTGGTSSTTPTTNNTSTVATGDFTPIAFAAAAVLAASVIVVFSRKREDA